MRCRTMIAALAVATVLSGTPLASPQAQTSSGAWAERVMLLYDADSRTVVRRSVRVWDAQPERNLDFTWEPAAGATIQEDDAARPLQGKGRLVWRIKGSPSYDPATIESTYDGELANGRPHGQGRLVRRSGETMEGTFADGLLDGRGLWIDVGGNRFEGEFRQGLPHGRIVERRTSGEIYEGGYAEGRRHGAGRLTRAGLPAYDSTCENGRETTVAQPDRLADANVSGVRKVQGGQSAADRTQFTVSIDQRMTQRADMRYVHLVEDQQISIFPEDEFLVNVWNGEGEMAGAGAFDYIDWTDAPAFVEVGLETTDGSRVQIDRLELQVASSDEYRKPMLTIAGHLGCVGFRPSFNFVNNGWGEVENATVSVRFANSETGAETPEYSEAIGGFDTGKDIYVDGLLQQAGVDVDALRQRRFQCPSLDSMGVCRSQALNQVDFGAVADTIVTATEDQIISTTAMGRIDYEWTDARGQKQQQSEQFSSMISLAVIEVPGDQAECGAGMGMAPEALRYQDIEFPIGEQNYTIDMPIRGSRNLAKYTARLKMHAERSSIHEMVAAAGFGDGSERKSTPISFYFIRPRDSAFASQAEPRQCYLNPGFGGC